MRHQAREIALQILFQNEFSVPISIDDFLGLYEHKVDSETIDYANMLVTGVRNNLAAVDALIKSVSAHWSLQRMPTVDKNILRMAAFEMKLAENVLKPSIVIDEAIELAKKYGSTDSSSFINGILDAVAKGN